MKKFVLVLGLVMALSLVSVASAATLEELQAQVTALMAQISALQGGTTAVSSSVPTITKSLTIGSRGDEVAALQMYLEDEGYLEMPIGVDYGYFGTLTKAAVAKWQKANDVSPASGYFGPISRAALEALAAAAPATPATESLCPNGMTLASNCTAAPVAGGTTPVAGLDNTDGSLSANLGSLSPTTQTLKKGDTDKPIYGIRLTATGGKVAVNRIDVHFSDRPWLMLSNVSIKDASGNVLASKVLTGPADVTTAVENSDYYIRFENMNLVVTPGTDTNIVVVASVPSSSSFVGVDPYDATNVTIPTGSIRTVNGRGIYDSLAVSGTNVVTFSTSGSAADLSVNLAQSSPAAGQVYVAAANGADTTGVPLAVYRFRSANQDSTIYSLAFTVATDPALGSNLGTSMKIFKLSDGTNSYYGSLSGSTVTFTISPGLVLTKDTNKELTLSADIAASSTAFAASTTLDVSAISATDANFVTPTYGGATMSGVTSDVTSSNLTFTNSSMSVSNIYVDSAAATVKNVNTDGNTYEYPMVKYSFKLTNGSAVNPLYVSRTLGVFLGTTTVNTNASSTINTWGPAQTGFNEADSSSYIIPAGQSRDFVVYGDVKKRSNTTSSEQLNITSINYGTTVAGTGSSITVGLEGLSFIGPVVTSY